MEQSATFFDYFHFLPNVCPKLADILIRVAVSERQRSRTFRYTALMQQSVLKNQFFKNYSVLTVFDRFLTRVHYHSYVIVFGFASTPWKLIL